MIGIYCHHTSRFSRNTGIQRCLRATARALAEQGVHLAPLVWSPQAKALALADLQARQHLAAWSGPPQEAWCHRMPPAGSWLLVVELISGPHHPTQPWLRRLADRQGWRLAAVFHDAIPLAWGGHAAQHHRAYMRGLADYDLVLATSATSRAALESFWQQHLHGSLRAQLHTLPLAAEMAGTPRQRPESRPPSAPLKLLCVGSLEPRKNHRRLLQALAWLEAHDALRTSLQLVGWPNDPDVVAMVQRAQQRGLPLAWDSEADDAALLRHYQACDLSVYPSLEEGFGLPVLESLWLGKPCVVGHAPALQEQAQGGGCVVVNTNSWQPLAEALHSLQRQPLQLQRLQAQLADRQLRSWAHYAHALLQRMEATQP
ncbi:MAG: glycosyltransferase family 4 protein [Cyanobacteria bacterium M_surface_9_m1_291]|nr:glycosyltransferase family 4 protein [Cyanobacteria bacterium M_surface_9_m1_291]